MFCRKCGKKIDEDSKFCEFCGLPIKKDGVRHTPDSEEKTNIGRWSWGGAVISFWYAVYMGFGCGWVILILFLVGVQKAMVESTDTALAGLALYLIMFFYLGLNSRKWAWKNRKWDNLEQFLATQRAWDIWGIVLFVLGNLASYYAK